MDKETIITGVTLGGEKKYHIRYLGRPSSRDPPGTKPEYRLLPPADAGEVLDMRPINVNEVPDITRIMNDDIRTHQIEQHKLMHAIFSNILEGNKGLDYFFPDRYSEAPNGLPDHSSRSPSPPKETSSIRDKCKKNSREASKGMTRACSNSPELPSIDGCIILDFTDNILVYDNGTPVEIPIRVSGKFTLNDRS